MKGALSLVLFAALVLSGTASAQEPVRPLDMRADSVVLILPFPAPDSLRFVFYFTIFDKEEQIHESPVSLSLDGNVVWSRTISFSGSSSVCAYDPTCSVRCEIQMNGAEPIWDNCSWWTTWCGIGCDPTDPTHTCQPLYYCACGAQFVVVGSVPYENQHVLKAEVDGPVNTVDEADETNNAVYYDLSPLGTQPSTWGVIKSLYR